jgi:hypothetical protein
LINPLKDKRILLILLLITGLFAAESLLAMWTGEQYDMNVWFKTGVWMANGVNIYVPDNHIGYLPLWAFWCLVSFKLASFFGSNTELWRFTIKLPLILAQFALSFAMWKFAQKRFNPKTAQKVFLFALTCSFFIFIGAIWGQINIISALLTFLAFYAVINKRIAVGAVLLGLAVALKIYPIIVLPAFLVYIYRNRNLKETGKFLAYACAVPVVFTLSVFAAYGWDILYFLKTVFYWAPVYDANPLQFQGGCMNVWSFLGLLGVDIARISVLRFLWIPVLGVAAVYWFRKRSMTEAEFSLSLISFYVLFMISYAWVSEQTFLDPLPFIFLTILAYQPRRLYLLGLAGLQTLVYAFSLFNGGPLIFEPLFSRFYPALIGPAMSLSTVNSNLAWIVRGNLGLVISVALSLFLIFLVEPQFLQKSRQKLLRTKTWVLQKR